MEKTVEVEDVMINGQALRLRHENIPIGELELDPSNPRIRYRLKKSGKEAEAELLAWSEVKNLRRDIKESGGLRERIFVRKDPKRKKYKVIEGNCRTVCIRDLGREFPDEAAWRTVPAKILPDNTDDRAIAILLTDFHVAGKLSWKPHEKAHQVYKMAEQLGMPQQDIALYMRTSKSTVNRLLAAYKTMNEIFLTMDDGEYQDKGEGAWSYFEELYKIKGLRERTKDEEFVEEFCRWVGDKRLPHPVDVRKLTTILADPEAESRFREGPKKGAYLDAVKVISKRDPAIDSEFFKLLGKMREALTNAAQVKEILKIRTDAEARSQLLKTYEALMDFMRLADVDPDEISESDKVA